MLVKLVPFVGKYDLFSFKIRRFLIGIFDEVTIGVIMAWNGVIVYHFIGREIPFESILFLYTDCVFW